MMGRLLLSCPKPSEGEGEAGEGRGEEAGGTEELENEEVDVLAKEVVE